MNIIIINDVVKKKKKKTVSIGERIIIVDIAMRMSIIE